MRHAGAGVLLCLGCWGNCLLYSNSVLPLSWWGRSVSRTITRASYCAPLGCWGQFCTCALRWCKAWAPGGVLMPNKATCCFSECGMWQLPVHELPVQRMPREPACRCHCSRHCLLARPLSAFYVRMKCRAAAGSAAVWFAVDVYAAFSVAWLYDCQMLRLSCSTVAWDYI